MMLTSPLTGAKGRQQSIGVSLRGSIDSSERKPVMQRLSVSLNLLFHSTRRQPKRLLLRIISGTSLILCLIVAFSLGPPLSSSSFHYHGAEHLWRPVASSSRRSSTSYFRASHKYEQHTALNEWNDKKNAHPHFLSRHSPPTPSLLVHLGGSRGVAPTKSFDPDFNKLKMQFPMPQAHELDHDDTTNATQRTWTTMDMAISRKIWDTGDGPGPQYKDSDYEYNFYYYYAKDDDYVRTPYHTDDDGYQRLKPDHSCQMSHVEKQLEYPVCNKLHELDLNDYLGADLSHFLSAGYFRETLVVDTRSQRDEGAFVVKFASMKHKDEDDFTFSHFHDYRQDGVIFAAIGPHPLLVDVYGYCSMGLLSEFMDRGTMEDKLHLQDRCEQQDDKKKGKFVVPLEQSHTASEQLYSISPLTPVEKLEYALDMAQALALLHNNEFGVIVHDDLKLDQFLIAQPSSSPASTTTHGRRSSGPRVKLNDFNRGEAMMYDYQHGEYCKYRNGRGRGPARSPEEYFDHPLDEKIDIYSLGNTFFSILTGEYVFPNSCDTRQVQKRIKEGERSFLDPRWTTNASHAEGQLVHIIQKCWEANPEDRYAIQDIIVILQQALEQQLYLDQQKNAV